MTDREINLAVCKALGWVKREKAIDDWRPDSWSIPRDQPWYESWRNRDYYHPSRIDQVSYHHEVRTPDFLNDPAESWRLMVWAGMSLASQSSGKWAACLETGKWLVGHEASRVLVLAFLASRGVEVKDE